MDFSLNKREELFLQMIRKFAAEEVQPLAAEVDDQERFPIETVEKMAKIGIMGIPIPVEYGGHHLRARGGGLHPGLRHRLRRRGREPDPARAHPR